LGSVLLLALSQFWVICNSLISVPHCPTYIEAGLKAGAVILGGAAAFGLAAWIGRRLIR
jgi:hypothetical protein